MPKPQDISGRKFGSLIVVKKRPDLKKRKRALWECKCECGNIIFVEADSLRRKLVTKCGKCQVYQNIGKKFGKLTVLRFSRTKNYHHCVICKCDCGVEIEKPITYLVRNKIISCGCARFELNEIKAKNRLGQKFYFLKIKRVFKIGFVHYLEYKCKCGKTGIMRAGAFGWSKSCGCLQKLNIAKGESSGRAKLSNLNALAIRDLWESKTYQIDELAKIFGVVSDTIKRVITRRTFKHI